MKKTISLLVCLVMVLGMLAACGGDGSSSGSAGGGSQSQSQSGSASASGAGDGINWDEHTTFTWWNRSSANDFYISYSENPVVKFLEEKFNVTFEFDEPVSGTEVDQLNLMLGTGQYTDVIDTSAHGNFVELYNDGVIIDLAPYLDYMPNLKALLDSDPSYARDLYDDEGRLLYLSGYLEEIANPSFGMMYRHDILVEATGGNLAFPSGKDTPTTLEDWEYMLPIYKQYFEDQGLVEYAPFILNPQGFFPFGELTGSFGAFFHLFVEDGQVKYGPMEDEFYNYLVKMNEWFEKGWIYQDFASRTQDMFFMPNTQLTYGGAAGVWMGTAGNLGNRMGSEAEGIVFDVRPLASPLVEGVGAEGMMPIVAQSHTVGGSIVVSTACENPEKLLAIFDYMFSEEGGMLQAYGLTKEQIPADDTVYAKAGLEDGAYWFDGDQFVYNPLMSPAGGALLVSDFNGNRFPGYVPNSHEQQATEPETQAAYDTWSQYDAQTAKIAMPSTMSYTSEEENVVAPVQGDVITYMSEMVPKFIMGTEPLTEENWAAFKAELENKNVPAMLEVNQQVYERYAARG